MMKSIEELKEEIINHPDFVGGVMFSREEIIEHIKSDLELNSCNLTADDWEVIEEIVNENIWKWLDYVDILDLNDREDFWEPVGKRLKRADKLKKLL